MYACALKRFSARGKHLSYKYYKNSKARIWIIMYFRHKLATISHWIQQIYKPIWLVLKKYVVDFWSFEIFLRKKVLLSSITKKVGRWSLNLVSINCTREYWTVNRVCKTKIKTCTESIYIIRANTCWQSLIEDKTKDSSVLSKAWGRNPIQQISIT